MKDKETELLIGVCEVDIGVLECLNTVDGYYRIKSAEGEELGVVKMRIVPAVDFKETVSGKARAKVEESPKFCENTGDEMKTLKDVYETLKQIRGEQELKDDQTILHVRLNQEDEKKGDWDERAGVEEDAEEQKPEATVYDKHIERLSQELNMEESETLIKRHLQNLEELDLINKRLRGEDLRENTASEQKADSQSFQDPPESVASSLHITNVFEKNLLSEQPQDTTDI